MIPNELPVRLEPAYFSHIWGGSLLKKWLNKNYTQNNVGESWEVSAHPKGNSTVSSGEYKGIKFGDYYTKVLGHSSQYPLLVKLIGPEKKLSVQVHPSNEYAKKYENSMGKEEAWYVISAPDDGRIVAGVSCARQKFESVLKKNDIESALKYLNCKKGDVITINPGLVHALMENVIVYEVQQNSDITYRIYDWNRVDEKTGKPRQLHIKKAMDVINFDDIAQIKTSGTGQCELLTENEYFSLKKISFTDEYKESSKAKGAYTMIEGKGQVSADGSPLFEITKGSTFYAPCGNNFIIKGSGVILLSSEK